MIKVLSQILQLNTLFMRKTRVIRHRKEMKLSLQSKVDMHVPCWEKNQMEKENENAIEI